MLQKYVPASIQAFIPYLCALLSGVLYVFSFAPWNWGLLQCFLWIPLFYGAHLLNQAPELSTRQRLTRLFALGFVMNLAICIGGFYWIVYATQQYGGLPLFAALAVFCGFSLTAQLQIPLFLLIRNQILQQERFKKHFYLINF